MTRLLNDNLVKLVSLLKQGEYHDGDTLGLALGMTRSAVWKAIRKLKDYGIRIASCKGEGYVLEEPLTLLDSDGIKRHLVRRDASLTVFESMPSTNAYLKSQPSDGKPSICLAERQTQGRGRFQREWYSPFARNIYLSCRYPFRKDISELSGLSLLVSLAVIRTLRQYGVTEKIGVKWPNDILYDQQKISGSLIEIQAETHGLCEAVIGIGINVNMLIETDTPITQPYTSMQHVLQAYVDRNQVCVDLLNHLFDYLARFEAGGLKPFMQEWQQADCLLSKQIAVTNPNETVHGCVSGISEHGHLLLTLADGRQRAFSSGDTSVVK